VNGEAELLWTRCGSEAYAAPELVTGGGGGSGGSREGRGGESGGRGVYDARKTDAWACGVVLYALVARHLPFGEGVGAQPIGGESRIGGGRSAGRGSLAERRHWLMRIARGEYEWPGDLGEGVEESQTEVEVETEKEKDELVGSGLIHSQGARRIVGRLLIRDPGKRARIGDLWDDSWMTLSGGGDEVWWKERERERERYDSCFPSMMTRTTSVEGSLLDYGHEDGHEVEISLDVQGCTVFDQAEVGIDSLRDLEEGEEGENGGEEEEEEEDGCLFDHEGIDSITRQEVV
jgi:protein-serine/threonine kinase